MAGLRAYLQETAYSKTPLTTPELLAAVGEVTDRLGRRGEAYVYRQSGSRPMLIMDPATGAVLGLGSTFTKDQPEYGVKAGDVMDCSAWTR
ncbi:hypothetical protein OH768_49125 [Streptomyces sp. NBC_01622]|uniref:hypothetical protein n=1 Tax=Streptomyces sp. NBC_01622 TaxID=2975903 RepID=UPI00386D87A2|nr:hypothetical protein OH768_49125 [Streptomyces sp. NBC_01622]